MIVTIIILMPEITILNQKKKKNKFLPYFSRNRLLKIDTLKIIFELTEKNHLDACVFSFLQVKGLESLRDFGTTRKVIFFLIFHIKSGS